VNAGTLREYEQKLGVTGRCNRLIFDSQFRIARQWGHEGLAAASEVDLNFALRLAI